MFWGEPARSDGGSHGRSSGTLCATGGFGERERGDLGERGERGERGDNLGGGLVVRDACESIFNGSNCGG